jgi:hypothetical protein
MWDIAKVAKVPIFESTAAIRPSEYAAGQSRLSLYDLVCPTG